MPPIDSVTAQSDRLSSNESTLNDAIERGDRGSVKLLIAAGANVTRKNGIAPLSLACTMGEREAVELLIAASASVDLPHDSSPIASAAMYGHADCIHALLGAGAGRCVELSSALCDAVYAGHVDCVRLLLSANASMSTPSGATALHVAAREGDDECLALLLDFLDDRLVATERLPMRVGRDAATAAASDGERALIDAAAADGATPLSVACEHGHAGCVRQLLDCGACVDKPDCQGATPLLIAAQEGHLDCLQLLLDAGAAIDEVDIEGFSAMLAACTNGCGACVELLSAHGASRGARVGEAVHAPSAAERCAQVNDHDGLRRWLQATRGWTPLHHLEHLSPCRLKLLLRDGADIHARPAVGAPSPLERARRMRDTPVAEMLLLAGAPWSPASALSCRCRLRAVCVAMGDAICTTHPRLGRSHNFLLAKKL